MNAFRLARLLLSKKLLKELLLGVQIFFMTVFILMVIVPFENFYTDYSNLRRVFGKNTSQLVQYNATANMQQNHLLNNENYDALLDEIAANDAVQTAYRSCEVLANVPYASEASSEPLKIQTNFILDSPELFALLQSQLQQGEIATEPVDNALPVVVSPHFAELYDIGETFTAESVGLHHELVSQINCVVTGVLKERFVHVGASELSFQANPNEEALYVFASAPSPLLPEEIGWTPALLLQLKPDADALQTRDALCEQFSSLGTFQTTSDFYSEQFDYMITVQGGAWNGLMLFLFALVYLFGFGGYIVINTLQKRKVFSILMINGMYFSKMLCLNLLSSLLITIPATVLGILAAPYLIRKLAYTTFTGITPGTVVCILLLFLGSVLFSIVATVVQWRRTSIRELYMQGE